MKNGRYEEKECVCWYKDGLLHREDGPAVEYPDGGTQWWINGNLFLIEEEQFYQLIKIFLNSKLQKSLPGRPKEKIRKI